MKKYNIFALMILTLAISSCAQQTVVLNRTYSDHLESADMQTFFIAGIGQNQYIPAAHICGDINNVSKVETVYSPINILATMFTLGIYSPRDAKVYCLGSSRYSNAQGQSYSFGRNSSPYKKAKYPTHSKPKNSIPRGSYYSY